MAYPYHVQVAASPQPADTDAITDLQPVPAKIYLNFRDYDDDEELADEAVSCFYRVDFDETEMEEENGFDADENNEWYCAS